MKVKSFGFYSKELFKGSLAISLSQVGSKFAGFLLLPVFTAYLSQEDYGIISIFTLIISIVSIIINPGVISAITRIYFEVEDKNKPELFASGYTWFVTVSLIMLMVLVITGNFLFDFLFQDFQFYPYGFIAVVVALFSAINRYWNKLMSLQYNMQRVAVFSVSAVVINLLASILFIVVFHLGVTGRIIGIVSGAVLLFTISNIDFIIACNKKLFSLRYIKKIWSYGSRLSMAVWAYFVLNLFDRYMIEVLGNIEQLGLYQVGYTLASTPLLVVLGAKALWNNIIYDTLKTENFQTTKRLNTLFFIVLSFITLGTLLFGKELTLLMTDVKFHGVIRILPFITLGIYFMSLQIIPGGVLAYHKRFLLLSKIAVIAAVINIVFNYFLIPVYGIMGAAFATLLAYMFFFIGAFVKSDLRRINLMDTTLWFSVFSVVGLAFGYVWYFSGSLFSYTDFFIKIFWVLAFIGFVLSKMDLKESIPLFNKAKKK